MFFRRALPEEASVVQALLHRAYADNAAAGFNFTASSVGLADVQKVIAAEEIYLLLDGTEVAGTFTLRYESPDGHSGEFGWFAVEPRRRGEGLGDRLLAEVERRARERGWQVLRLDTPVTHPWLPGFYQRRGFIPVKTIHYEGKQYDSVVLEKAVGPGNLDS